MESLCILFPGLLKVESGFKLFILTCCGYSNGCMDDIKYENKSEEKSRNEMNYLTPALFLRLTRSVMLSARLYRKNNEFIRIKGIRLSGTINPSFMVVVFILINLIRDKLFRPQNRRRNFCCSLCDNSLITVQRHPGKVSLFLSVRIIQRYDQVFL